jgi:hypothetical protein
MILPDIERDETFNLMMFLIHKHPEQAAKLLRDTSEPRDAWKHAFGTLDMPESFWKEYADFSEEIGEESLTQNPKAIYFKGWKDVLLGRPVDEAMSVLDEVEEIVGAGTLKTIDEVRRRIKVMAEDAANSKSKNAAKILASKVDMLMKRAIPMIGSDIVSSSLDNDTKQVAFIALLGLSVEANIVKDTKSISHIILSVKFTGSRLTSSASGKVIFSADPAGALKASKFSPVPLTLTKARPRIFTRSLPLSKREGEPLTINIKAKLKCGRIPLELITSASWAPRDI